MNFLSLEHKLIFEGDGSKYMESGMKGCRWNKEVGAGRMESPQNNRDSDKFIIISH